MVQILPSKSTNSAKNNKAEASTVAGQRSSSVERKLEKTSPVSASLVSSGCRSATNGNLSTQDTASATLTKPHADWISSAAFRCSGEWTASQDDTAQETRKSQPPSRSRNNGGGGCDIQQVCDIQGLFIPPSSRSSGRKVTEDKVVCCGPPSLLLVPPSQDTTQDHISSWNGHVINHSYTTNTNSNNNPSRDLVRDPHTRPSVSSCSSAVVPSSSTNTNTTKTHNMMAYVPPDSITFSPEAVTSPEGSISLISSGSSASSSQTESRGNNSRLVVTRDSSCDLALTYFRESINVDIISTLNDLRAAIENLTISVSMVNTIRENNYVIKIKD